MKKTTYPLRRNAAIIAAAAVVGGLGIGGVITANADDGSGTPNHSQVEQSDGDGEENDATENEQSDGDGEENDATENEQSDGDGEENDATENEQSDGETNDDATDQGPDANPDEPGHQDASDNG